MTDFVHLHVHTQYSLLDGATRIKSLIQRTKELGMKSVAITDHGVMFGVIDFYKEAKKAGIKPIIGCEVYTAARNRLDKDPVKDKRMGHLVLLAKNQKGYKNLMKIVSLGYMEGFYYKPRIDYEVLIKYSEGIIALSACLAGSVQQHLLLKDYEGAKKEALRLNDLFGQNHFYLELQDHGIKEQEMVNEGLIRMSEETGIPLVATNDVHYLEKKDAKVHDLLLCIQTGKNIEDENRLTFPTDQFYLKSSQEMNNLFSHVPKALQNTVDIANRCNVEFEFHHMHLPKYEVPKEYDPKAYLRKLCEEGLKARYENTTKELWERLDYELSIIENMGYVEYFLIVWDFIHYAKKQNIMVGPGRGSAAGSIVSYTLGITDIDPIKYHLIFERFLNPERVTMPDIDIDFCYERRQEVIDYVVRKYGKDKVAQIITFGTMAARAAIRDVGRALNRSYQEVDQIAKEIPMQLGITIDKALNMNKTFKDLYEKDDQAKELIDIARAVEGMPRHASTHAAGVVISKEAVDEYVPLYMHDESMTTQFTMTTLEELGLLKMDFLGLRNLTVIRDALESIEHNYSKVIDFSKMEYNDSKVFELISRGDTLGVFQLESAGMRQFMKELKPDCFEDIIAGISLYRPGPMDSIPKYIAYKKQPDTIKYLHPLLEPILKVTYGCLIYQEQVMQVVRELGGYSYGRSDLVRRAMSKKKMDVMEQERNYFIHGKDKEDGTIEIQGCIRNGVPEEIANEIYDEMIDFAKYAFNKSHAAAYAVLGYETAYLKRYYPVEFMAALMTSIVGNATKVSTYIEDCKKNKIRVLPPHVNDSKAKFIVENGKIRFGLLAVKNVGLNMIEAIVKAREEKGKFISFTDFLDKVDLKEINKRAIESLIKAGAFDDLGANRAQLLAIYENTIDSMQQDRKRNLKGQVSLFQDFDHMMEEDIKKDELPSIEEFSKKQLLMMEKEVLGMYMSGHPLSEFREQIEKISTISIGQILEEYENHEGKIKDGDFIRLGGIVLHRKNKITKSNNMMAFITLEDLSASIEVLVFPKTFDRYMNLLKEDEVIVIEGRVSIKEDEEPKIIAQQILPFINPIDTRKSSDQKLYLKIDKYQNVHHTLKNIKDTLRNYPGSVPVYLYLEDEGKKMIAGKELWVNLGQDLIEQLTKLLGVECVKIC